MLLYRSVSAWFVFTLFFFLSQLHSGTQCQFSRVLCFLCLYFAIFEGSTMACWCLAAHNTGQATDLPGSGGPNAAGIFNAWGYSYR
jgi:hypothetical protein